MIHKDVYDIFTLIANDKYVGFSAISITSFTILLALFFSPLAGLIIYGSYILGYGVCWCLIKYQHNASLYLLALVNYCYSNSVKKPIKQSCSICDDLTCRRHQQTKSATPWKHLCIPKELNSAIEQFYNKILENFITSWYSHFTEDVDFINELKYSLRFASATFINRFLELDHAKIISNKLLPYAVQHIDDYLKIQQMVIISKARFNDKVVEYLGKRLHIATSNRKNELAYLQHLSSAVMGHVLPDKQLQCQNYAVLIREILAGWVLLPLMDVLADPNIINSLTILAITYKAKRQHRKKDPVENVEFLDTFLIKTTQKSSFATDLNAIKEDKNLLYCFIQFLKREEHVHLLQFCLDVDEFNNKLLRPELTKQDLEELHSEALDLYKDYLNSESLSFIGCSSDIIDNFQDLIKGGAHTIAKLRTSKPLFQAYEHTFNLLENVWLPSFFHSNEFYGHICGSKIDASYNKSTTNRSPINFGSPTRGRGRKYYEASNQGTVSRISSGLGKIKGALKTAQPIDGAIFAPEAHNLENGAVEDIITECGSIFRDLSAWRISILSYKTTNKIVSFCINVQRLDAVDDGSKRHWIVFRRDQDFYTLKAKLVEFHGESEICDSPLPSRKAGGSIDIRMERYEDFLKRLLQKPSLRGSDLLYSFLSYQDDFSLLIATGAQNAQDLGNFYQSVAHKLRKEKGQHLDSFMSTFLASTTKSKSGKLEWAEIGDEADTRTPIQYRNTIIPKTYRNHIFNDNFGITFKPVEDPSKSSFNSVGFIQCIFFLLKDVFKVPTYLLRLYAAICNVAHEAVESFACLIVERKLKSSLCPSNLAILIKLLEDVIFHHSHPSPTKEELEERKTRAFEDLKGLFPSNLEKLGGNEASDKATMLLEILQHPQFNKQLAYHFLDMILIEMYPNLAEAKD